MGLIEVKNISHSFGDKVLYTDASFELFKGEHLGLVGQNGTGKTTLMSSIIGEVIPDKGEIRRQSDIRIGYLDQHAKLDGGVTVFDYLKTAFADLYEAEATLNRLYKELETDVGADILRRVSYYQNVLEARGFYMIDATVLKVADGLGVTAFGMDSLLGTLSGGQRAKVILSKLLLEKPSLLLLDEPTNFLDKEHIEWLVDYLKGFEGAFIVISHDFDFLDKITNCICDIEFGHIEKYSGNFTKFLKQKALKRENYINQYASQQKQIKNLEEYIAKNKARASTANMAKSRQKQLDKIDRISAPEAAPKPNFRFESLPITTEKTLVVKKLEIGYYYSLLPKLNFEVLSGQKIVITGFNGIGKSTLLKTLVGEIPPVSGGFQFADTIRIAYFEQDLKWEDTLRTPVQIVWDKFPRLAEKQVRKALSQCGIKAKHAMQPVETLSGGEQAKVKLCILMLTKANLLILDEPTNHLDSDTKEALRVELVKWKGSIIFVSHEAAFYKDWADKIIHIGV